MNDYIVHEMFRKPLLDYNRQFYPECRDMDDDEFERYLLSVKDDDPERDQ